MISAGILAQPLDKSQSSLHEIKQNELIFLVFFLFASYILPWHDKQNQDPNDKKLKNDKTSGKKQ